ncbi:MAG: peptidase M48, partial [Desulfuromonadales bacterium]|nr:peptidase M48 [Desulfuromonadales bacterium]
LFDAVVADVDPRGEYRLLFRASEKLGANALALPGNTVVVTDGLVR